MKKNDWGLYLKKDTGDVKVDSFKNKQQAEEELKYRNSLCIAMGYTPDSKYVIKKSEM
jgi:hypothetical protein